MGRKDIAIKVLFVSEKAQGGEGKILRGFSVRGKIHEETKMRHRQQYGLYDLDAICKITSLVSSFA